MAIKDWPGGVISKTPVVPAGAYANSAASGVWTLDQVAYWNKQGIWPNPANAVDPYFYDVTLLLTGDGTNGAQNNTFLDSSTNNFTITRNGNTTQGTFSPYGNLWSNYFDGSGDYLYTASNTAFGMGTGDFTWEAWLFPISWPSAGNYSCILQIDGTGLYVGLNNSGFGLRQSGTANIISYGTNPTANTWTHVAIVRSGTTCTMYYNGVSVATATSSANFSAGNAWIGSDATPGNYYTGYASNMRLVKGTALYTSNFTPSTTPLTAVSGTSLLTCQSNRFIDNSSNNFTLTRNGDVKVQRFSPFNPTAPYSTSTIGGSGYFDGSGDYLTAAANTAFVFGTGAFTIEAWVYAPTWGSDSFLISNLSVGNTSWCIEVYGGNINFGGWTTNWLSATAPSTNAWHHIAVSRSGTTLSMFVDGVRVATASNSVDLSANNTLVFGDYVPAGGVNLNGYLSNARLVKGTAVYDPTASTCTVPTAPLTAITNTSILCNFTNAGIPDAAMMNDLETVGNAQVSTSVVKYGTGSLAFDGTGDYLYSVATPNTTLSGDFTIECWAYLSSTYSAYPALLTLGDSGSSGTGIEIQIWGSGATVYVNGVIAGSSTGMTNATNTWIHWAVVRSGNSIKIYKNGTSFGATGTNSTAFTGALRVGVEYYNSGLGNYWYGYIDDLRITKGYARYTANFTPPTAAFPTL